HAAGALPRDDERAVLEERGRGVRRRGGERRRSVDLQRRATGTGVATVERRLQVEVDGAVADEIATLRHQHEPTARVAGDRLRERASVAVAGGDRRHVDARADAYARAGREALHAGAPAGEDPERAGGGARHADDVRSAVAGVVVPEARDA